jgi:hypothetical protein
LRQFSREDAVLPPSLSTRRVDDDVIRSFSGTSHELNPFHDPLSDDEAGKLFDRNWIAAWADVQRRVGGQPDSAQRAMTGLKVIAVTDREEAMQPSRGLGQQLARMGSLALLFFLLVSGGLLFAVFRSLRQSRERVTRLTGPSMEMTGSSIQDASTILAPGTTPTKN